MLEIDTKYKCMVKSDRIKIEQWVSNPLVIESLSLKFSATAKTQRLFGSGTGTYTP